MGQTINKVTYYTDDGIYEIPMDQKVAKKFDGEVSVADISTKSDTTSVVVSGLPSDFEEEYKVDGIGIDEDAYSVEIKTEGKTTTRTIKFKKLLQKVDIPLHLAIRVALMHRFQPLLMLTQRQCR